MNILLRLPQRFVVPNARYAPFASWLIFAVLAMVLFLARGFAQAEVIDFEGISQELPLWTAALHHEGRNRVMPASEWKESFALVLDNDVKHSGGSSLRWEFSQNVDRASLQPPMLPVAGSEVTVRLFVRAEGMPEGEGQISFEECEADQKVSKVRWSVVKFRPEQEWAEVLWTGNLETAPSSLRVRVVFDKVPAGAKIWVDDFDVQTKN